MTANAGYKAYAAGDVLTAAQVQYNLQNQTVMYFATTTARDAALTGTILVEGLVSYTPATKMMYYNGTTWVAVGASLPLTTTGDTLYSSPGATAVRLGIGSTGQTLTVAGGVPSWATPASGSMTLLSTTTLSGTSTTITSIDQTYQGIRLKLINVNYSGTTSFYIQVGSLGNQLGFFKGMENVNVTNASYSPDGNAGTMGNTAPLNCFMDIFDYATATANRYKPSIAVGSFYSTQAVAVKAFFSGGFWKTAAAITLVTLTQATGETISGTVEIWGIK